MATPPKKEAATPSGVHAAGNAKAPNFTPLQWEELYGLLAIAGGTLSAQGTQTSRLYQCNFFMNSIGRAFGIGQTMVRGQTA